MIVLHAMLKETTVVRFNIIQEEAVIIQDKASVHRILVDQTLAVAVVDYHLVVSTVIR